MSTNDEDFILSGPSHLTAVDWENSDHQRIVMGSLVKGVYVQQSDRVNGHQGSQALAPSWWTSFHFTVEQILYDQKDHSICGTIYQLNPSAIAVKSPKYVVAFRGTQIKEGMVLQDLKLDWNILINKLFKKTRFKQSIETVKNLVTSSDGANTWLAGHSLGAAIALLVGKELTKNNYKLQTYLFNPPNISIPIDLFIKDEKLKKMTNAVRTATRFGVTVGKYAMVAFIRPTLDVLQGRVDPFEAICEWVPHLYVNPADPICSEYIGYFENRETMREYGFEKVERIANRVSLFPLLRRTEPIHLLASAELNINEDRLKRHSLQQWYDVDLRCQTVVYLYKPPQLSLITSSSSG